MEDPPPPPPRPFIILSDPLPSEPLSEDTETEGDSSPTSGFQLSDLLTQLEDYQPTIPESLSLHFLHSAGFSSSDPRMVKLISLASQKFISDILNDCYTMCKLKGGGTGGGGGAGAKKKIDKKFVLTVEDLVPVLNDYGITVKKPPYYL